MEDSFWQIAAWQAAVVGVPLAGIQLLYNYLNERRARRRDQAELSHRLIDSVFDDPFAARILKQIDLVHRSGGGSSAGSSGSYFSLLKDALDACSSPPNKKVEAVQFDLDCLLYYLNRIELSLQARLLLFSDVKHPFAYYFSIIEPFKDQLKRYCEFSGYQNVVKFLDRFPVQH